MRQRWQSGLGSDFAAAAGILLMIPLTWRAKLRAAQGDESAD
jgi:hypothetical protein